MGLFSFFKKKGSATAIRPYGSTQGDGLVQVSFTLPIAPEEKAREAARLLALKIGIENPEVVSMDGIGKGFSNFVVYGRVSAGIEYDEVVIPKRELPSHSVEKINQLIREKMGRPLVVVGGTIGGDQYAVGIDALLSVRGLGGDRGLESYAAFRTHHLRSNVSAEEFVQRLKELKADVVLLAPSSNEKTQTEMLARFMQVLKNEKDLLRSLLPICVETHLSTKQALQMGYAAVFSSRPSPSQVANAIVQAWLSRG